MVYDWQHKDCSPILARDGSAGQLLAVMLCKIKNAISNGIENSQNTLGVNQHC